MSDIMVSICCLTYNHEQYIRGALDSFLMQKTDFKFEILIHDDASTDNTPQIIKEYEEKYPDIIKPIYQSENQYSKGVKATLKYQFPRVKGKYIAMCEGDDYWCDEDKLQKQFDILEKNLDIALCVHDTIKKNMQDGSEESFASYSNNTLLDLKQFLVDYLRIAPKTLFQTSSLFFRSEHISRLLNDTPQFFMEFPVGDIPLELFLGTCGKIYYLTDIMSVYRKNAPGSWTTSKKKSTFTKRMRNAYQLFDQYTGMQYTELLTQFIDSYDFQIKCQEGKYREVLSKKYVQYFKELGLKSRMYILLGAYMPKILNKLNK